MKWLKKKRMKNACYPIGSGLYIIIYVQSLKNYTLKYNSVSLILYIIQGLDFKTQFGLVATNLFYVS